MLNKTQVEFRMSRLKEAILYAERFIQSANKAYDELFEYHNLDKKSKSYTREPIGSKIFAEARRESLNLSNRLVDLRKGYYELYREAYEKAKKHQSSRRGDDT